MKIILLKMKKIHFSLEIDFFHPIFEALTAIGFNCIGGNDLMREQYV